MTPINRDYNLYIEEMLTSMLRIEEYIGKMGFNEFKMNYLIVDAIIRNFEIKMYGLRNLIAHEYFGIDYEMIWEISKNDLPQNAIDIKNIIKKEKSKGGNNT